MDDRDKQDVENLERLRQWEADLDEDSGAGLLAWAYHVISSGGKEIAKLRAELEDCLCLGDAFKLDAERKRYKAALEECIVELALAFGNTHHPTVMKFRQALQPNCKRHPWADSFSNTVDKKIRAKLQEAAQKIRDTERR